MPGWGDVVGWVFDRLPTRREGILNEIRKINEKREDLQTKWLTASPIESDLHLYVKLGRRLSELEGRLKTFKA